MPLPTLAMTSEGFQVSDRDGAAIASAELVDYGVITADQRENVIEKNKLRAATLSSNIKTKKDEEKQLKQVKGIWFNSTLTVEETNHMHHKPQN